MYSMIPFQRREGNIFRYMDDIEKSFFNNTISGTGQFRCDISEKDGAYLMHAELPGFDAGDIQVEVDGDMLTISASHSEESGEKDGDGNYIRRERRFGSFARSFSAEGIDVDNITASYKNGVLSLDLPKAKADVKEARKIEVKASEADHPEARKVAAKPRKMPKLSAKSKAEPKKADPKKAQPDA